MTVDERFLTSCVWARFYNGFPHNAWAAYCHLVGSRVHANLAVTCHLKGLLRVTAETRGWSGCRIRVSIESELWRSQVSRPSCQESTRDLSMTSPAMNPRPFDDESGDEPATFRWRVRRWTTWAVSIDACLHCSVHLPRKATGAAPLNPYRNYT